MESVSIPSIAGQKVLRHSTRRKTYPFLDADAVHLSGSMIPAAQAADGVAQVFQRVRQIRPLGSLHLLGCEAKGCILFRVDSPPFLEKRKEASKCKRNRII